MNELDVIKKSKNNLEYWSARDLMKVLGYEKWQKFEEVIKKAKSSCIASNNDVMSHFIASGKMISTGKSAKRKIDDYLLTRYACYIIAQNGDSRKSQIAILSLPPTLQGSPFP